MLPHDPRNRGNLTGELNHVAVMSRSLPCCSQGIVNAGGRILLHPRQDMRIQIERDADLAVT